MVPGANSGGGGGGGRTVNKGTERTIHILIKKRRKKKNRTRCLTLCKGEGPYDEVAEISIRRAHVTPSYSDQRLSEAACERISPGVQIERLEASGSLQRASISQEATAKCFGQSNKWQRDTDAP